MRSDVCAVKAYYLLHIAGNLFTQTIDGLTLMSRRQFELLPHVVVGSRFRSHDARCAVKKYKTYMFFQYSEQLHH